MNTFKPKWSYWDGEQLKSPLAFDTETDMPPPGVVPNSYRQKMVVLTACDGHRAVVVSPDQVVKFVLEHVGHEWVGLNTRFDFWVVRDELERRGSKLAIGFWDSLPVSDRLRDVMIMDFLIRLATVTRPEVLRMKGLMELSKEIGISIKKDTKGEDDEEVRTGFGRYLGLPVVDIPNVDLDYAVLDAVATWEIFKLKQAKIETICKKNEYGYLTDSLQVRSDIALGAIGKRGIAVDQNHQEVLAKRMGDEIESILKTLVEKYPLMFDYWTPKARNGQPYTVKRKKDTGLPALKRAGILGYLKQVVEEWSIPEELIPLVPAQLKKTKVADRDKTAWAIALEPWLQLAKGNDFVDTWTKYSDTVQMYGFVKALKGQEIMYADYRVLKVTGRTSCTGKGGGVNIQQWPRLPEFRHLFIARSGRSLIISDYSAIELCTFASVALDIYKTSKLAEVLRTGVDPHAYTAALCLGMVPEEFYKWKTTNPDSYKQHRQAAKAINFGVPGGLGPRRLAGYARANYQVEMSVEQASTLRTKLITEVYPEMGEYLKSYEYRNIAHNLACDWKDLVCEMNPDYPSFWYVCQRIVGVVDGLTMKGKEYSPKLKSKIWGVLNKLDSHKNPELTRLLQLRRGTPALRRMLFGEVVETRTGRLRAGADYGEARNTRFQGLAADGAKLALWTLHQRSMQVVAFIHDEVVVEIPDREVDTGVETIEKIMRECMSQVVGNSIPIKIETKVSKQWTK